MKKILIFFYIFSILFVIKTQRFDICSMEEEKKNCRHKNPDTATDQCCWVVGTRYGTKCEQCVSAEKHATWEETEQYVKKHYNFTGDLIITCSSNYLSLLLSFIFLIFIL